MLRRSVFFVVFLLLFKLSPAWGQLSGSAERIEGLGLSIEGLDWEVQQGGDGLTILLARAERVILPGLLASLESLELQCAAVVVDSGQLACLAGQARVRYGADGPELGIDDLNFARAAAAGQITVSGQLRMDQLETAFALEIDAEQISATFEALSLSLPLLAQRWPDDLPAVLDGTLAGHGIVTRDDSGIELKLDYSIENAAFDSSTGLLAGAAIGTEGSVQIRSQSENTAVQFSAQMTTGEFLASSLYIDFSQAPPLAVRLVGELDRQGRLMVSSFELDDGDGLALSGSAQFDLGQRSLSSLELSILELELDQAYGRYLEPVASALGQQGLLLSGAVRGQLKLSQSRMDSLDLLLDDVWIVDGADRFSLEQLGGEIHMRESGQVEVSKLGWQAAHVYQVRLGNADVHFTASTLR